MINLFKVISTSFLIRASTRQKLSLEFKIEISLVASLDTFQKANTVFAYAQAGLCLCCSQTPKTGFPVSSHNYHKLSNVTVVSLF